MLCCFSDDHPDDGPLDDHEEYSDYGSFRSGDVDNRSSVSKAASVSLTSGIDEFSDSDSQLVPLFQTSFGDKPPIEFYHLTDPPKTASSMDWEMAGNLADTESGSEDDIVLGVSPSKLKRLFFSNDYIEVVEVPTFGQVDYVSFDPYKCVELLPGLKFSAEQDVDIQPPDQLIIEDCTRVTLHSPPPKPIPVPKVPSLPPPPSPPPPPPEPKQPPPKDPTPPPPPPPVSKPKRKPIVKKTKTVPKAKKKTKPTKEDAIPRTMPPEPLSHGSEANGVEPLPDVLEEEEPVAPPEPSPPIPSKVVPLASKKDKPKPRPAPPRLTSPSPSIELESIQEEIEYETDDFQSDDLSLETPPPLKNKISVLDQSHVELNTTPTVPPDKTPPPPPKIPPPPVLNIEPPESVSPPQEEDEVKESQEALSGKTPLPPPVKDAAFLAEQERERLAEERRQKAYDMFERLKSKRFLPMNASKKPSFKDEGWLAQFFIIKEDKAKMYQQVFSTVDEDKDGYLNCFETLMALKGISGAQKLTEKEEAYIVRVLELAEYSISQGTDVRLFSVLAALSQRIASIDTWVRNMINSVDLTTLEWKITKGKELFEWCIDEDTRLLHLDRFLVELKAGGVSQNHQEEVELTLGSKGSWDLIDFLSYLPLFIMTHESVVNNPLDDSREK